MDTSVLFDRQLINRYDTAGPRYTSYPTALQFSNAYDARNYIEWVQDSNDDPIPSDLSLYFHIPFCDTVCYYCGCNKIVTRDKQKAEDYIQLLMREIALQGELFGADRRVTQMHWGGGTPTFLDDAQISRIIRCANEHFNVDNESGEFAIEADPRTVDSSRIERLRQMGFNRISFGVQDFDPDVQRAVNRVQETRTIIDNIAAARRTGFRSINIDLMYGLPLQSLESFRRTLQTTLEADPDRIALYNYAHMPDLFKPQRRIDDGTLPLPGDKLDILQLAIDSLQTAGYVYIGMDHFAKRDDSMTRALEEGRLQRNFQGYSTHAGTDIVAMGITAISQIGGNYSQNVKSLDEYEIALSQRTIPVTRGCELDADDMLRRDLINKLMCDFRLDIPDFESEWDIRFADYFDSAISRLREMQQDGLLEMDEESIRITPAGRLLVRIICMEFDRYLKERYREERYSRVI